MTANGRVCLEEMPRMASDTVPYNNLAVDALSSSAIGSRRERSARSLGSRLITSLLFHERIIFVDANVINHLGLRELWKAHRNIFDCLKACGTKVYLRQSAESLESLMIDSAKSLRFSPNFGTAERYLGDSDFVSFFDTLNNQRFDISRMNRSHTDLILRSLKKKAVEELFSFKGPKDYFAKLRSVIERFVDDQGIVTQADIGGQNRKTMFCERLKAAGIFDHYWSSYDTTMQYLEAHCYRRTAGAVLEARTIITKDMLRTDALIDGEADIKLKTLKPSGGKYLYPHNLVMMDPDTMLKIRAKAKPLFAMMGSREVIGDRVNLLADANTMREYLENMDACFESASWSKSLRTGPERFIHVSATLAQGLSNAAEAVERNDVFIKGLKIVLIPAATNFAERLGINIDEQGAEILTDLVIDQARGMATMGEELISGSTHLAQILAEVRLGKNVGIQLDINIERSNCIS